jgi:glucosylceramidase
MTRLLFIKSFGLASLSGLGLVFALSSCGSDSPGNTGGTSGNTGTSGAAPSTGGSAANAAGTAASSAGTGNTSTGTAGSAGAPPSGTGGNSGTAGAAPGTAGTAGTTGSAGTTGADPDVALPPLVTSSLTGYWKTDGMLTDATADATLTVNDTMVLQTWEGFGGAFNELGWKYLTTPELQAEAMKLLFSAAEGANLLWGRIPMGASDYAEIRYTLDNPAGTDPDPAGAETARPKPPANMDSFSLSRDETKLIPYIKAAQAVKSNMRFWASPWTPPIWMKSGWAKKDGGGDMAGPAKKPSYFDGGNVPNTASNFTLYAEYYKKFVEGYKAKGIDIEIVSPQNEPGYSQNYPSALWTKEAYVAWIKALGAVMQPMNVRVMLGTLSNAGDQQEDGVVHADVDLANAVMADANAKSIVSVVGAQWGVLDKKINAGTKFGDLPVWATEHRCGNYPWEDGYNNTMAPNDQDYAVESWGYIRDAIKNGGVTSYAAWNMVLDKLGLGNDLTRDWKQNALLVVDGGKIIRTPTYYVFRHLSQYVKPLAKVVGTSGSGSAEALAFKNPDGSLVAVVYSATANPSYVVAFGSVKKQFSMPAGGWATIKLAP